MGDQPASFDGLANGFGRKVFQSDDPEYLAARAVWNAMIDRRPALIARCRGTADVIAAVDHARDRGMAVSIPGGAHNVAGHAVGDGALMIDMSLMGAVHVDPARRIAVVEGGAVGGDVDRETQIFGLATPGGLISDTGVAGLTQSGRMPYCDVQRLFDTRIAFGDFRCLCKARYLANLPEAMIDLAIANAAAALTEAAFGSNDATLVAINTKYDPTNMFRFNQNIAPEI